VIQLKPVFFIEGIFILIIGLLMLVPGYVDWISGNPDWQAFVTGSATSLFVSCLMIFSFRARDITLDIKQGFFLTTTSWLLISAFSAIPFTISGMHVTYTDAFFEAISGLTTTGSTILTGLDSMPPGILLWRSILQWIGGIGIIAMAIAMLPFLRIGGMQLFRMESSDKSDKVLPRAGQFIGSIALVYLSLSCLCALSYWWAGMTSFEAINHAMTTISTGGFSTSDQSLGHFASPSIHWISTGFMLLGGLPFVLYVKALHGRWKDLFLNSQVRCFVGFLVVVVIVLSAWLSVSQSMSVLLALRLVAFHVVSVVTTTGFATTDYSLWGDFSGGLFFFLTFVGGCTGSTAGGIKMFRFEIMFRVIKKQIHRSIFPNGVFTTIYNSREIDDDVARSISIFVFQFFAITVLLSVALSLTGVDIVSSLTGAATSIANVGPGLGGIIGPSGNFASLPDAAKWILSIGMIIGRLEIVTVLVLLTPGFWRW